MKSKWLPAALAALFVLPAGAAEIALIPGGELAFGAFVAGTGTVKIAPGGLRTTSPGVVGLSSDGGSAAQFSVTGDQDASYTITLPEDGVVFLSNNGRNMPVNEFTSSPFPNGSISGTQTISVGATLAVAADQAPGSYSGNFTLVVEYN